MNYELAKQLKEAGFPQPQRTSLNAIQFDSNLENDAYAPTLEELIEACGENFDALIKKKGGWQARSRFLVIHGVANDEKWIGETHAEAVAKLWLALNKPPQSPSL